MAIAFKREAEAVLREGGYELARHGKHPIYKHPDAEKPIIQIPSSPRDPDHALVRLRRAVRVGSTPHIPQGREQDIVVKPTHKTGGAPTLVQTLVGHAPSGLKKRANEAQRTGHAPRVDTADLATWVRKCLTSHGIIANADLNAAADDLYLNPPHLSAARVAIGAQSFKYRDAAGAGQPTYTAFKAKVPEDAVLAGRRQGGHNAKARRPVAPVTTTTLPTDPDEERGRPLVGGDLTDEQRQEAQERMRRSTELADAEAAAIRERLARGGDEPGVTPTSEPNSNGKKQTQLEAMLELVREAALEETHALTDEDILMLRGTLDNLERLASDLRGMQAGISLLLKRVDQREAAKA